MRLYRDQGIVLRTHSLGEADRIVTIFMRNRGIVRAVAKGVRRTSSKFGARLEPFMMVDIQCYEGRSLDTVTQVQMIASYGDRISADFDTYGAAHVMVETAERLSTDGPSPGQYRLLSGALRTLADGTIPHGLVRDAYLIRAIALAGWAPSFDECVSCGAPGPHGHLAIQIGGVVCDACKPAGVLRVTEPVITLLSALLEGDWATVEASPLDARGRATGIVTAYVQWHLERGLKSLVSSGNPPTRPRSR